MKTEIFLSLMLGVAAALPAFAAPAATMVVKQNPVPQAPEDKAKNLKDILSKLVRQDEFLDEAVERLSSPEPLTAHDLSALGVSLKTVANNLAHVSALNKAEFSSVESGGELSNYTNAILSYSRKVDRKAAQVSSLVAKLAAARKSGMRDAVSSKRGGKKAKGRKLAEIAAEQEALEGLAADAGALRGASKTLGATSKWLHIASK